MTDFARLILDADTSGLKRGERDLEGIARKSKATAGEVDKAATMMSAAFKRIGTTIAALGAGAALVNFGRSSIQATIDAQEMQSAFEVVFGSMAEDMRKWAEEVGNAMGRSTQEIQRGALAFQELFGKALQPEKAAEMSRQFAVLTQDLASFKNLSNEVAQQKLFSGLIGEAEPLRAVGVFLSESAIKAEALALGLGKGRKELTDQEKIIARASVIQKQLAQASGDVERTSGSAANQIKSMNAAVEELQIAIGSKLLPQLTPLITATADVINRMAALAQSFNESGLSLSALARVAATMASGWAAYRLTLLAASAAQSAYTAVMVGATRIIGGLQAGTISLNAAMAANPFGAVALAVGVLTTAFVGLSNAQAQARAETDNLIRSLDAAIKARGPDVAAKRAEADVERMRAQQRLTELETRLKSQKGVGGGFAAQALGKEITELRWKVVQLEGTVRLADRTLADMAKTSSNIAVPAAVAATAIGELDKKTGSAAEAAKRAAQEFQQLYDRLLPREAAERQYEADRKLIESNKQLTAARKEELLAALEQERFRNRTANLAPPKVNLPDYGPLVSGIPDMTGKSLEQLRAEAESYRILRETGDVAKSLEVLKKSTQQTTVTISESFAQMSRNITASLQGLANSIQSGNFLGILGGILDIFTTLGSTGLFGKGIQSNLNKSVAGARAAGGQVNAGRTYLVGEKGPELFTPQGHGRIAANKNVGGSVHVTVGVDPKTGNVTAFVDQRVAAFAPAIAGAGASLAQSQMEQSARRRVRG